jgi:hypothetical protein
MMLNLTRKLMHFTVISVFAATSIGSVVADEVRHSEKHDEKHDGATTLKKSVITVTNYGGSYKITAEPTVIKISGPGEFSIITPSTGTPCKPPLVVAQNGRCTIGVQYTSSSHEISIARVRLGDSRSESGAQETQIMAN